MTSDTNKTQQGTNMKKGKNQHVTPHKKGWAVKGAGNTKATKVTDTQKEAIKKAEAIAKNQKLDTKIHGRDGNITLQLTNNISRFILQQRRWHSYNDDNQITLVLFFLKHCSDVWQEYQNALSKIIDDEALLMQKINQNVNIMVPEKSSFHYLKTKIEDPAFIQIFVDAIKALEEANKQTLAGIFSTSILPNIASYQGVEGRSGDNDFYNFIKELINEFSHKKFDMQPSVISEKEIGNVFQNLIAQNNNLSMRDHHENSTPQKISELVAQISNPKEGASICDPACGQGGMLLEAAKIAGNHHTLSGMEIQHQTWAICRMNMILNGYEASRIEQCDTLLEPALVEDGKLMKFTNIICDPPIAVRGHDHNSDPYNRFKRGLPPISNSIFAFINHMIESAIEKEGRITVLVPLGALFRSGKEGNIRRKIIEENLLDAVITLPSNLLSYTAIEMAILVFDRSRELGGENQNRKDIVFINASNDFIPGKIQNKLADNHFEKILTTYHNRKIINKYSTLVSFQDISKNDFDLSMPLYVSTYEKLEINPESLRSEINNLEQQLVEVREKMQRLI